MWELDHKEGWVPKNWCFWIVVLEKTLESSLDSKVIKPVNPKGNQLWIFIGRINAEAPILWPLDAKSQLTGKDPDAGKDWGLEKRVTEDEVVGWHHWLNELEFEETPRDSEGQGSLACYCSWDCKESDMTQQLNNSNILQKYQGQEIQRKFRNYFRLKETSKCMYGHGWGEKSCKGPLLELLVKFDHGLSQIPQL